MSMQTTSDNPQGDPMLDINVTPLIDVMLVLLIMFIITIPPQTHAVSLDLPQGNNPAPPIQPTFNTVVITPSDQILWNGAPVTQDQLRTYFEATQQMDPTPELHLQPDPNARYELVDQVLAVAKRAHVEKMGFVGNEYYQNVF